MSEISAKVSKRSNLLRAIGTIIAVGLLVYLLRQQGWQEILNALKNIPVWRVVLAFFLIMASRFAVSMRWQVLLRTANLDISFGQSLRITFAGLFATNFLPTTIGGDVVRLAGLLQCNFDAALSTASLIADRLVGLTGMALVLPFGLARLAQTNFISPASFFYFLPLITITSKSFWSSLWSRAVELVHRILSSLKIWLNQPTALAISVGFTLVHMLCFFLSIYILLVGMGESISLLTIGGLYSLVYFITLLPFTINGYGLQELSMTFIFYSLGSVSLENSLTVALLHRTLVILSSLPGAFFVGDMISEIGVKNPDENKV